MRRSLHEIHGPLFGQPDLEPRKHARRSDPETSKRAALVALQRANEGCRVVYDYLLENGARTDYEGEKDTGLYSYRRRRADLKNMRLVKDSGITRPNPETGSAMTCWRVSL